MVNQAIKKVLIANRGEIALRVQRACDKLGIASAVTISDADVSAYFARAAKEVVRIGPAPAQQSYLDIEKIVRAAKESGCNAVHPGYGFLAENADFAEAVVGAGLVFVGPSAAAIRTMGDKTAARKAVGARGVPCTPGSAAGLSDRELVAEAERIGFPVIIKAVAGGGGRGMRVVSSAAEMGDALPRARAEALKNFSNESVYIEKYISHPRHVEIQVFGDSHGNVIHFGTRDCSAQRRHQKLVEEAPAFDLSPNLRERIHAAAVEAAKSVSYVGAGTVECLVEGESFYFLEMNTRIQVEHPVTEEVTGVDLVELQLKVAAGEKLPIEQKDVRFDGHAIELRVYAEDPAKSFQPAVGKIGTWKRVRRDFLREDSGYEPGDQISPYYDAMLSKLIVKGADRRQAIDRALEVLREYEVKDLPTTLAFHRWLLRDREFRAGRHDIGYVDRVFTPAKLEELETMEAIDPAYSPPVGGAERTETFFYSSRATGESYEIKLIHRAGGYFLAVPVDGDKPAKPSCCRRSNGMKSALESLIRDVLEPTPRSEIFGAAETIGSTR